MQDTIRWSIDIRFMRPEDPSGFSGATNVMLLRKETKEGEKRDFPIDWNVWGGGSGGEFLMKREEEEKNEKKDGQDEEISGPWMDRWRK